MHDSADKNHYAQLLFTGKILLTHCLLRGRVALILLHSTDMNFLHEARTLCKMIRASTSPSDISKQIYFVTSNLYYRQNSYYIFRNATYAKPKEKLACYDISCHVQEIYIFSLILFSHLFSVSFHSLSFRVICRAPFILDSSQTSREK